MPAPAKTPYKEPTKCQKGEVEAWYENGKLNHLWVRDGVISVNTHALLLEELQAEDQFDTLVELLTKAGVLEGGKMFICIKCGDLEHESNIGHRHFAGKWCKTCGEQYRRANSRRCFMCGQPYHSCTC